MKKIVLTGGPCAGKTTTLSALRQKFGSRLYFVPEAATMLLSAGFPMPGRDVAFSPEWQQLFQGAIAELQPRLEAACALAALESGAELLVCDRGLLDGAAYTPGGLPVLAKLHGVDVTAALGDYDRVLHLESVASCQPSLYGKAGNESRMEDLATAQQLEQRTREAWSGHRAWTFISGREGIESVKRRVIEAVAAELRG